MGGCLFVCYQDYAETTVPLFTKCARKVGHGPGKKPLDFGGNPDHVTLGLGLRYGYDWVGVESCPRHCNILTGYGHTVLSMILDGV